jgi:hypothetical protein
MKYATEMRSSAMIYILSFTKIGSGIQKLVEGVHGHGDTPAHRQHAHLLSLLLYFQNKDSMLIMIKGL